MEAIDGQSRITLLFKVYGTATQGNYSPYKSPNLGSMACEELVRYVYCPCNASFQPRPLAESDLDSQAELQIGFMNP